MRVYINRDIYFVAFFNFHINEQYDTDKKFQYNKNMIKHLQLKP